MNLKYTVKSKKLYDRGNEALSYRIEIPHTEGLESINEFYGSISENCERYCNSTLFETVCETRRVERGARYSYRFVARVTHCADGLLSVLFYAHLREGRQTLSRYVSAHTWDVTDQCLLPPRCLCKRVKGLKVSKKLKKNELEGLFLCDGEITDIKNADVEKIMSEYREEYATKIQ